MDGYDALTMKIAKSATEWLDLPELDIPVVQNDRQGGRVYHVRKVGFVNAAPGDCAKHDLPTARNEIGVCPLPTCVVDDQLYRLPISLADLAVDTVALTHAVGNPFPCRVEFGLFEDRHYAQAQ
jgi:hypothetical protein